MKTNIAIIGSVVLLNGTRVLQFESFDAACAWVVQSFPADWDDDKKAFALNQLLGAS